MRDKKTTKRNRSNTAETNRSVRKQHHSPLLLKQGHTIIWASETRVDGWTDGWITSTRLDSIRFGSLRGAKIQYKTQQLLLLLLLQAWHLQECLAQDLVLVSRISHRG